MTVSYEKTIDPVLVDNFVKTIANVVLMHKRFPGGGQRFDLMEVIDHGGLYVQYRFTECVPGCKVRYMLVIYKVTREVELWEENILQARYYTALPASVVYD